MTKNALHPGTRQLSNEQVRAMRLAYKNGEISTREISEMTKLSVITIGRMLRGETYQNVSEGRSVSDDEIEASMKRMAAANGLALDLPEGEADGLGKLEQLAGRRGDAMVDELRVMKPTTEPVMNERAKRLLGIKD